jgi:adenylate kinase
MVMIGPPGAGKGTQARLLEERLGVPHISTGDMLREAERAGTPLGRAVQRYLHDGGLVPDALMIDVVEKRLATAEGARGFVLDGFPRTVAQAEALGAFLARRGERLDGVVYLRLPREELVRRLSGRRVCARCGAMFHLVYDPPARPGVCDRCGGPLVQREDDREETVRHRLDVYERETGPVVEHYRALGLLREVDGMGSRTEVFDRIVAGVR